MVTLNFCSCWIKPIHLFMVILSLLTTSIYPLNANVPKQLRVCPLLPHFRRVKPKPSIKENWELLLCSHAAAYLLNSWSKMSWLFLLGRGTCQGLGEFEMKTACRSAGNLSANLSLSVDELLGLQRQRQREETLLNPQCKAQVETIQ